MLTWSGDWSPDGTELAFSMNRDGWPRIYVARFDPSRPRWARVDRVVTATGMMAKNATWSPDGQRLAYTRVDPRAVERVQQVCVVPSEGGTARVLWQLPQGREVERLTWSADQRVIYCSVVGLGRALQVEYVDKLPVGFKRLADHMKEYHQLEQDHPEGLSAEVVEAWERRTQGYYRPQPDGGYSVLRYDFDTPTGLVKLDVETGSLEAVPGELAQLASTGSLRHAAWSPHEQMVVFGCRHGDHTVVCVGKPGAPSSEVLRAVATQGIEEPFVVLSAGPSFPLVLRCRRDSPQDFEARIAAPHGWPTVSQVRLKLERALPAADTITVDYDLNAGTVSLLDQDGVKVAELAAGSEDVADGLGVQLLGHRCSVESAEHAGLVKFGLAFQNAALEGEWKLRVTVLGETGEVSQSPTMGWVQVLPATSPGQAAWERVRGRDE